MYRALFASLQPKVSYDWEDPEPDTTRLIGFKDPVVTPESLKVLAPVGGSVFSRAKQIELRWIGNGNLTIIISTYYPFTGKTRPILQLQPTVNTGKAVIEPRILALLPPTKNYVFTFIIANRFERPLLGISKDRILEQAASVYNSYLQIQ
jgi:hypothetical protein